MPACITLQYNWPNLHKLENGCETYNDKKSMIGRTVHKSPQALARAVSEKLTIAKITLVSN